METTEIQIAFALRLIFAIRDDFFKPTLSRPPFPPLTVLPDTGGMA
jgi:hypothetical protein